MTKETIIEKLAEQDDVMSNLKIVDTNQYELVVNIGTNGELIDIPRRKIEEGAFLKYF